MSIYILISIILAINFGMVARYCDTQGQQQLSLKESANGLTTCLLAFSLTLHGKSTNKSTHTLLHNVSLLYVLYYEYIAHSLHAITVLALVQVSHSNTTIILCSMGTLACAIALSISLHFFPSNKRDASSHQGSF